MIPKTESENEQWDSFENAATYSYARSILRKDNKKDVSAMDDEKFSRDMTKIEYVSYSIFLL